MNEEQREVAERLIVRLDTAPAPLRDPDLNDEAAALLRELLAEPVHESKPTTASQFESVKQAKRAAEYELRYYTKMMKEKNAAPQQRRPLTDKEIIALPAWDDYMGGCITLLDFARAVEKAHGITGEQK